MRAIRGRHTFPQHWLVAAGLLLAISVLGGCREKVDNSVLLGIVGYNYTHRYIHTFAVGGSGGGNVNKSHGDSGGGAAVCCIGYDPDRLLPITLPVKWMFGYERGPDGKIVVSDEHHETTAILDGPVPDDPRFLEVHFMPDGSVRLMITAERSAPLVQVDRSATPS